LTTTKRWAHSACLVAYTVLTAILGRDVLAQLGTSVANDAGDPLLTTAILHWNARHIQLTETWWQFPVFYPTRDALAFSEHLLGLSVIATPIDWLTGDALATYNLSMLLTFPLSAAAMYSLTYRLTGSVGGAFIAGLAYGFAPYRISHLPHVQFLAAFWAPLALLGLHAYVESGRRRWLVLYGLAWMLQVAANVYCLFLLSILVGLWGVWFVLARRNWRAAGMIAATTAVASLPLSPILYKYFSVHTFHGFERSLDEIRLYGADLAAVLCAPSSLTFWGWIRVACRGEGELFPGVALAALCLGALVAALASGMSGAQPTGTAVTLLRRAFITVALVYAVVIGAVLAVGPWSIDLGLFRVSASSAGEPALIFLGTFLTALVLSPPVLAACRRWSTAAFYFFAALATWLLALGPTISFMGAPIGIDGPFNGLLALPGGTGMRAPARFWLMTLLCLSTVAGIVVARLLRGRRPGLQAVAILTTALAVVGDGWVDGIRAQPVPRLASSPEELEGKVVITLPFGGPDQDVAAQLRAVTGGWTSVNGYSAYEPAHYPSIRAGLELRDGAVLTILRQLATLYVDVPADDTEGWRTWLTAAFTEARLVAESSGHAWYELAKLPDVQRPRGSRSIPFAVISASCNEAAAGMIRDGARDTRWDCATAEPGQEIVVDLFDVHTVSAIGHALGPFRNDAPRSLRVDASIDGITWRTVWSNLTAADALLAALEDPRQIELLLECEPAPARYLRLTQTGDRTGRAWSIAELRVFERS
jgi:hypothetical protein